MNESKLDKKKTSGGAVICKNLFLLKSGLTAFSREPPPKKATDSACVRNLECMNLQNHSLRLAN